jgi:hypothetical protein
MQVNKTSLDLFSRVVTTSIGLIAMLGLGMIIFSDRKTTESLLTGICIALLCVCYLFSAESYVVDADLLIIKRPFGIFSKKIPLSDIREIKTLGGNERSGLVRTFAAGGVFGYWGWFHSRKLGNVYVVARNMKNLTMIVLKSNGRKLILSPDENTPLLPDIFKVPADTSAPQIND